MEYTDELIQKFWTARAQVRDLDEVVLKWTAFRSFRDLVEDSLRTGYRPTMQCVPYSDDEVEFAASMLALAEAYDKAMQRSGSDIRAWRGSRPQVPAMLEAPVAWALLTAGAA